MRVLLLLVLAGSVICQEFNFSHKLKSMEKMELMSAQLLTIEEKASSNI